VKRLVVANAARADLRAIRGFTEREWGAARRDRYLAAIRERFELLQRRPEVVAIRRDLGSDYRVLSVGRHLIIYRYNGIEVTIVRVLHQRVDIRLHL